jgi:hypothetical protein
MDDEAMRFWLSSAWDASASGKWVQRNKALPKLGKKPKMLAEVRKHMQPVWVSRSGIITHTEAITFPAARAIPFIRRITKGLLYGFYPEYDYFADSFMVKHELRFHRWEFVLPLLKAESRGDEVFEVWHGLAADTKEAGIWVYRFYGHGIFICMHRHGEKWKQPALPGYKEFAGLPEFL